MSVFFRTMALAFPIVSVFILRYLDNPYTDDLIKLLTFVGALNAFLWMGGNVRVALNQNSSFLVFGVLAAIVANTAVQFVAFEGIDRVLLLGATLLAFVQILDPIFRGLGLVKASHLVVSKIYLITGFVVSLVMQWHLIYTIIGLSAVMWLGLLWRYWAELSALRWQRLTSDDAYVYSTSISNYLILNFDILLFLLIAEEDFLVTYYLITRVMKIIEPVFSAITDQFVFDLKDLSTNTAKRVRFNQAVIRNISVGVGWFLVINLAFFALADKFAVDFPWWMFVCLSASFLVINIYSGIGYFLISTDRYRHNLWISLVPPFTGILYLVSAYVINHEWQNNAIVYYVALVAVVRFSLVSLVLRTIKL